MKNATMEVLLRTWFYGFPAIDSTLQLATDVASSRTFFVPSGQHEQRFREELLEAQYLIIRGHNEA